ncbi:MAG: zf-TFIIB domain-containing protein [Ignavibacteriales bacterium]|nr:zf-TFIIB domain-containing protein [Ignavibacteriales bacterium]
MEKVLLGYTLVDKCPNKHGLWFDAGELGALLGQYSMPELQDEPQETKIVRFLGEVF